MRCFYMGRLTGFELPKVAGRLERSLEGVRERDIFIDSLLVRVHSIIEMSRPALRHGSLNSLFQVALYLPSSKVTSSRIFLS